MKITKLRAGIATAATAAVLGIGGFALAAFVQNSEAQATSKAATFAPVVVTGAIDGQNLLPGDSTKVTLTISNPTSNTVNAKVTSITADGVDVAAASVGGSAETAADCATYVNQKTNDKLNIPFPTIEAGKSAVYVLNNGVTLNNAAPITCQGMSFTTKWKVTLEPVR